MAARPFQYWWDRDTGRVHVEVDWIPPEPPELRGFRSWQCVSAAWRDQAIEDRWDDLCAVALDLLMQGVDRDLLLKQLHKIPEWRALRIRAPFSGPGTRMTAFCRPQGHRWNPGNFDPENTYQIEDEL